MAEKDYLKSIDVKLSLIEKDVHMICTIISVLVALAIIAGIICGIVVAASV